MAIDPRSILAASLALPAARPVLPGETLPPAPPAPLQPSPSLPTLRTITVPDGPTYTVGLGPDGLTRQDRKLFGGTAAAVIPGATDEQLLSSIGCNFVAEVEPALYRHDGHILESSETTIWKRSDNGQQLGSFGNRREPIQPTDYLDGFRNFVAATDGALSLDVIGTIGGGKVLYFASKLAGRKVTPYAAENRVGDITDQWLVVTSHYGQSLADKVTLLSNQLICCNGMSQPVNSNIKLRHSRSFDVASIGSLLQDAASQSALYLRMMDTLVESRITQAQGIEILEDYFKGQDRVLNNIRRIYTDRLIGGSIRERQGTLWGLQSAVTQYTSHERIGKLETAFRSQLDGSRARLANQFAEHLLTLAA